MTSTQSHQAPYKQLRRPTTDRMVAGVASGLGRYFVVDPTLVRVLFAVATLVTGGFAALAYPIMWFLMPEEPAGAPAWPHPTGPATRSTGYAPQPAHPSAAPTTPAPPHNAGSEAPTTPLAPPVPPTAPTSGPVPPTAG
ncbi:PspC domain-containing protein [Micromonospora sp. NPDC048830]|uniref:PspC domain-containing protein n=1 Tax=Micromonospora sp. NPDC048830 TaxID=3364257 RepID=UPI00371133D3